MKKSLILALLAFECCVQAQDTLTVSEPYNFPTKPGTQAWGGLNGQAEKIAACEIPISVAKNMTTDALVKTCLSYPLRVLVLADSGSPEYLDSIFNNFYGFKELASRKDAGECLIKHYPGLNDAQSKSNVNSIDLAFLHWLYTRPELISIFSVAQKEQLTNLSFRYAILLHNSLVNKELSIFPIRYGLTLMVNHNTGLIKNGNRVDKSILPASAIKFVNPEWTDKQIGISIPQVLESVSPYVK